MVWFNSSQLMDVGRSNVAGTSNVDSKFYIRNHIYFWAIVLNTCMWILSFIPDSYMLMSIYAIIGMGLGLLLAAFLLTFIIGKQLWIAPYRTAIHILGWLFIVVGVYLYGGHGIELEWRNKVNEVQAKVDIAEKKSADANRKLAKKSASRKTKVVTKTLVVKQYIDREVTKYNDKCDIPVEFKKAHDDAAEGPTK
jgi:hypothetical protein